MERKYSYHVLNKLTKTIKFICGQKLTKRTIAIVRSSIRNKISLTPFQLEEIYNAIYEIMDTGSFN